MHGLAIVAFCCFNIVTIYSSALQFQSNAVARAVKLLYCKLGELIVALTAAEGMEKNIAFLDNTAIQKLLSIFDHVMCYYGLCNYWSDPNSNRLLMYIFFNSPIW